MRGAKLLGERLPVLKRVGKNRNIFSHIPFCPLTMP
ncbi:hypothetical protein Bra1253DRAFT_05558 [Bradyrhizobium sp. WSM1253]|nr:hypothetical protein Bra1253DRAFT_05558 [Bradyrhizobium sp. WSM1253]